MIKYIPLTLIILLGGCSNSITEKDIEAAEAACKHNGGVFEIKNSHNHLFVTCKNRASFELKR